MTALTTNQYLSQFRGEPVTAEEDFVAYVVNELLMDGDRWDYPTLCVVAHEELKYRGINEDKLDFLVHRAIREWEI